MRVLERFRKQRKEARGAGVASREQKKALLHVLQHEPGRGRGHVVEIHAKHPAQGGRSGGCATTEARSPGCSATALATVAGPPGNGHASCDFAHEGFGGASRVPRAARKALSAQFVAEKAAIQAVIERAERSERSERSAGAPLTVTAATRAAMRSERKVVTERERSAAIARFAVEKRKMQASLQTVANASAEKQQRAVDAFAAERAAMADRLRHVDERTAAARRRSTSTWESVEQRVGQAIEATLREAVSLHGGGVGSAYPTAGRPIAAHRGCDDDDAAGAAPGERNGDAGEQGASSEEEEEESTTEEHEGDEEGGPAQHLERALSLILLEDLARGQAHLRETMATPEGHRAQPTDTDRALQVASQAMAKMEAALRVGGTSGQHDIETPEIHASMPMAQQQGHAHAVPVSPASRRLQFE